MANVGSVELDLELNRQPFDRELSNVENLKLNPLHIDAQLETKNLFAELKNLSQNLGSLNIDIGANIDTKALKTQVLASLDSIAADLQINIKSAVESTIKVETKQQSNLDRGAERLQSKLEGGMERVAQKLNEKIEQAIETSLRNVINTATGPFRQVFTGVFEGVGQNIGNVLSRGLISTFQQEAGVSLKNLGTQTGSYLANVVNELRGKQGGGGTTGVKPQAPVSPKGGIGGATVSPEIAQLLQNFNAVSQALGTASKNVGRFGSEAINAAEDALKLATALTKAYGVLQGGTVPLDPSKKNNNSSAATNRTSAQIQDPWMDRPVVKGFLRGDRSTLTPDAARQQVEATRTRLQKRLEALQQLPGGANSKQLGVLLNAISTIEAKIATDIADPSLPEAVRRSLGQLKGVNSKLAGTRRALVAESARASAINTPIRQKGGLSNVIKTAAGGGIGATILGAGSAFAAPGPGVAGLGILGGLPFDPTLGLAALGIGGSLAAAKLAPGILRRAGARKAADILETDVGKLTSDAISGAVRQVRNSLQRFFTNGSKAAASRNTQGGFVQLPFRRSTPVDPIIPNQSVQPPMATNAPSNYWDRFFRGLEARFYRSPLFSGNVSPKERRSLTSEATGFLVSGAALAAPGATLALLATPLITALTPLLTTVGLVGNALTPLIGTVSETLRRIEPLQKRLEFTSGGKVQAGQDTQFIQGLASQYNISEFSSLEQFSKFQAAAKGTKLEGEQLRSVFEGIIQGGKALSLTTNDLNGIFFAFTQILSKGKLSAEEIRLQIAERFPPAVGVFSRALGVSQQEFTRLLESGSLLAEDVLPKVGRQLKLEFGEAAKQGSRTFEGALTRIDNAINRLKAGIATGIGPLFATVANSIGAGLELISQNAQKLVSIFSVVLIGITAQFGVGLTTILEGSGILAKLQAFLIPAFGRLFATLTPFFVGILADFLDDVLGARASVMENMMKGAYNIVYSMISVVVQLKGAADDLLSSLPKAETNNGLINALGGIFDKLKNITKFIPSTVVELTALTLILAQTYILVQQGTNLILARFGLTLVGLGQSFLAAATSGKVLQSVLTTLKAGLTNTQFLMAGLSAAVVLFFAKADFSNELSSKFDDLGSRLSSSLEKITLAVDNTNKSINGFRETITKLPSKGFDLTFGIGEQFFGGAFRTDDLINSLAPFNKALANIYKKLGLLNDEQYKNLNKAGFKATTLAEQQFNQNILKLSDRASAAQQIIDASGLLNGNFGTNKAGTSLAGIKIIDQEIKQLQNRRVDLLDGKNINTPAVKREIAEIDGQIQSLLAKREQTKKPIEEVRANVLATIEAYKATLKDINESAIPEADKERLRALVQPTIDLFEKAKRKLEELGAIDLSPLGKQFTEIAKNIEIADFALEKTLGVLEIQYTKDQTKIQQDLLKGGITSDVAVRETSDKDVQYLKIKARLNEKALAERRGQLNELLAVPKPTAEQQETIDKTQKDIEAKELNLAQIRLQISQKLVGGKSQVEERILKDFQRTNAAATAAVQQAETQRLTRIKQRQLQGQITPEQVDSETQNAGISTAKDNLAEAKRQLKEFAALKKTGRISSEEAATRELELNKNIADANLRLIESEIAARESAKQKRLAGLDEIRQRELANIELANQRALVTLKRSQIKGAFTEDSDRAFDAAAADLERLATDKKIEVQRRKIADLDQRNFDSGSAYTKRRLELETELGGEIATQLDQRLALERRNYEEAIRHIQRRAEDEERYLDRSKQLLESRRDLINAINEANQTIGDAEIQQLDKALELRQQLNDKTLDSAQKNAITSGLNKLGFSASNSELDILNQKQQIESDLQNRRIEALEREQQLARDLLRIDLQRQRLTADTALLEAQIASDRAVIARFGAAEALTKAIESGDTQKIESAQKILDLNDKIVESTQRQLDNAKANLNIQDELATNSTAALNAQQQAATTQAQSAKELATISADIARAEAKLAKKKDASNSSDSNLTKSPDQIQELKDKAIGVNEEITTDKPKQRKQTFLERARALLPPIRGVNTTVVDQSKHEGLDRGTSVESQLKSALGLDPLESAEDYFKRLYQKTNRRKSPKFIDLPQFPGHSEATPALNGTTPTSINDVYRTVLTEVAKKSGVSLSLNKIPKLEINDAKLSKLGAGAIYESDKNTITINKQLAAFLASGLKNISLHSEKLSTLIHESRHALQFGLGEIPFDKLLNHAVEAGVKLSSPNNLPNSLLDQISRSVAISNKESGGKYTPSQIDTLKALETDAYSFERQFGADITSSSIKSLTQKRTPFVGYDPTNQSLTDATTVDKKLRQQTQGFTQFVEGLKVANQGIEQRLDKLIDANTKAIASPRTLNVSSANPVSDASKIMMDMTRMSMLNSGLG